MISIDELLREVQSGELIGQLNIPPRKVYHVMHQRTEAGFSHRWMTVYEELGKRKAPLPAAKDSDPRVGQLRELTFTQSYIRWQSHDLSSFISDDFGIIGDAIVFGYTDTLVGFLLREYLAGRFPVPHKPRNRRKKVDVRGKGKATPGRG